MKRLICVLLALATAGCSASPPPPREGKIKVVAGLYPLAEAVRRIGGSRVDVTDLTAPGAEPHDLELTSRQVDLISDADLIVYTGKLQPALYDAASQSDAQKIDLLSKAHLKGTLAKDPHFWLNAGLFAKVTRSIESKLGALDPKHKSEFAQLGDGFRAQLDGLDRAFRAELQGCARTTIVSSHAAFGHLVSAYRLNQVAISGLSPETEPDPKRLAQLTDVIRSKKLTTVFVEPRGPTKAAETLAREAGVTTTVLDPIESLTTESLSSGRNYGSIMVDNLSVLKTALDCR